LLLTEITAWGKELPLAKKGDRTMILQYLGHSAFRLVTAEGISILIDPYLDKNPLATAKAKQLIADYIIVTHAHGDHLGDTLSIARPGETTIICVSELASVISKIGFKVHAMQIGGAFLFEFGRVKLVQALHGSVTPDGIYGGLAAGVVLTINGVTIYHCGDTGLFGDMQLIGQLNKINYLLIPIGGNYTMDIEDAAYAVGLIKPQLAIPMHYNTFPMIQVNPQDFVDKIEARGYKGKVMTIGEEMELGKKSE